MADFPNLSQLAEYLQFLLLNETAYEQHRLWRKYFSHENFIAGKPLLKRSWQCSLCHWAAHQYRLSLKPNSIPRGIILPEGYSLPVGAITHRIRNQPCDKKLLPPEQSGRLYRVHNQRTVYLVRNGMLHAFPDGATFMAMGFDFSQIKVIPFSEFEQMLVGEELPHKS